MLKKSIFAIIIATHLISCGGGGGGNSTDATISGNVADGYLRGAIVCADENGNKKCDDNESQAETGENGVYTLPASAINHPIIAEVRETTVDEDTMVAIGSKTYTLSTTQGKAFISPITTAVQNNIANNPTLDTESAAYLTKANLSLSGNSDILFDDYISNTSTSHQSVYQAAQITARVMAEMENVLKSKFISLLGSPLSEGAKQLIRTQVDIKMQKVAKDIYRQAYEHIDGGGSVSASFADTSVGSYTATINAIDDEFISTSDITRKITNIGLINNTISTAKDGIANGMFFASYNAEEQSYYLQGFANNKFFSKDYDTTTFTTVSNFDEAQILQNLTTNPGSSFTITVNNDNSIAWDFATGENVIVKTFAKQSLAGMELSCSEIMGEGTFEVECDPSIATKTVTFANGDYRYAFTYKWFERFKESDIDTFGSKTFTNICPTTSTNGDDAMCYEQNSSSLYDAMASGSQTTFVDYWSEPKIAFWTSSDGTKIEACHYTGDNTWQNAQNCSTDKNNLGTFTTKTLQSGETIFIYPAVMYDSGSIYGEKEYRIIAKKDSKYYRVNSSIKTVDETKVQTYKPFNWSAYQKIANEFPKE